MRRWSRPSGTVATIPESMKAAKSFVEFHGSSEGKKILDLSVTLLGENCFIRPIEVR